MLLPSQTTDTASQLVVQRRLAEDGFGQPRALSLKAERDFQGVGRNALGTVPRNDAESLELSLPDAAESPFRAEIRDARGKDHRAVVAARRSNRQIEVWASPGFPGQDDVGEPAEHRCDLLRRRCLRARPRPAVDRPLGRRVRKLTEKGFFSAGGGSRTLTPLAGHLILSQARMTDFATPAGLSVARRIVRKRR